MGVFMIRLSLQVFTYHLPLIKCVKGAKLDMKISKLLSVIILKQF